MLYATICLLLLSTASGVCPVLAGSPQVSSRSGGWPSLCNSLSETFEAYVGKDRLRRWTAIDDVRGSPDHRVSLGGCPD
jgi:hypothetical protein